MAKRIGVLTVGGDCPGSNAAIRAIGKAARGSFGMEVIGFQDGFTGMARNEQVDLASRDTLSGILTAGGTILGTSRDHPNRLKEDGRVVDATDAVIDTIKKIIWTC